MTKTRLALLGELWKIQAHPAFRTVDIVTNWGSPKASDDQVRNHIAGCLRFIASRGGQ
ncbi:hypothetical protein [Bradyrhizobium ivorense]|uniref:hypothetical protein n=1 Tax=Bradyrhizobium ivorense TaxID=2511166 RepID=UPI0010B84837|nr:hypothetical protein [Bradyrhizobium ivorense]VIO73855.1 hypothetical protein CI41S_39640 [Bradyrhizobium ivorense]